MMKPDYEKFAREIVQGIFDGDTSLDLGDVQERAIALGVLKEIKRTEPCHSYCEADEKFPCACLTFVKPSKWWEFWK